MTTGPVTDGNAARTPPVVLAIAATDSGGGAGLAADLATLSALGVHGTLVVTAITAQDTTGVHLVHPVPMSVVAAQLEAVLTDLPPLVVKTGMLGAADTVRLVAERCAGLRLVVDPVLRATTGAELADHEVLHAYRRHLLPVATVITPNASEARALLGLDPSDPTPARELAAALAALGPAVVLTGGPSPVLGVGTDSAPRSVEICTNTEWTDMCTDWLATGGEPIALTHPAVHTAVGGPTERGRPTENDHGTGCTFASALAAHLARGADLPAAARDAAAYVTTQLQRSSTWDLGAGRGPIAHTHLEPVPAPEEIYA
jgi:hydroxymethylpyrimidine/phosphomethylpyrimidine kinase